MHAALYVAVAAAVAAAAATTAAAAAGSQPFSDACASNAWAAQGPATAPTVTVVNVTLRAPLLALVPPLLADRASMLQYYRSAPVVSPAGVLYERFASDAVAAVTVVAMNMTAGTVAAVASLPFNGSAARNTFLALLPHATPATRGGDDDVLLVGVGGSMVALAMPSATVVWQVDGAAALALTPDGTLVVARETDAAREQLLYTARRTADGALVTPSLSNGRDAWGVHDALATDTVLVTPDRHGTGYLAVTTCARLPLSLGTQLGLCAFNVADGALVWVLPTATHTDPTVRAQVWLTSAAAVRDTRALPSSCAAGAPAAGAAAAGAPAPGTVVRAQPGMLIVRSFEYLHITAPGGLRVNGMVVDTGALMWKTHLNTPDIVGTVTHLLPPPSPPAGGNVTLAVSMVAHAVCEMPGTDLFVAALAMEWLTYSPAAPWIGRQPSDVVCAVATFRASTGALLHIVPLTMTVADGGNCAPEPPSASQYSSMHGYSSLVAGATCRTAFLLANGALVVGRNASAPPPPPAPPPNATTLSLVSLGVDPFTGTLSVTAVAPAPLRSASHLIVGPCDTCVTVFSFLTSDAATAAAAAPTDVDAAIVAAGEAGLAASADLWADTTARPWFTVRYIVLRGDPLPPLQWPTAPPAWSPQVVAVGASLTTAAAVASVLLAAALVQRAGGAGRACRWCSAARHHVLLP